MSDNVFITPGVGSTIATDDIAGVQYQRVKATFGVDGAATDVSAANPLPITAPGTIAVTGAFYPATQPVSGTVSVSGTVPVNGTFYQATQPVSIASMPSTPVTGTFWQATQPVSGTITANAGSGTFAISAAALPLPSGASTETTLAAISTKTLAAGQATMANSSPVVLASNQSAVPVSGTFWQATQPVSGNVGVTGSVAVTGTFWQATQPVSGTVTVGNASLAVTGTFWQATQPISGTVTANAGTGTMAVSIASLPALATGANVIGAVTQSGTWNVGSITTLPALVAGSAVVGKVGIDQTTPGTTNLVALAANQSVNQTQVNGVAMLTGNGITGTGSMRVTIASDNTAFSVNAVQSGAWSLTANQSVNMNQLGGTAVATNSGVVGGGVQRVVLATDVALPAGANTLGTTTGPTLTKGTQGASGYSVQDLKDGGRAIVNVATAIAGVTAVTTEALLALSVSRDGAATSSISTIPVTSGKRYRVTQLVVGMISTAAAVLSGRFSLRMNPAGAVTASSPIIATLPIPSGAALAQAGGWMIMDVPDGIEFSGTMQIGVSQVCSAITGTIWASLIGFEY